MGIFDDVLPGGTIAKPLMIALGALLVGKMMSGGGSHQSSGTTSAPPVPTPEAGAGNPGGLGGLGGLLSGGLGGLLQQLNAAGHGEVANSWVGHGENQPIQPQQLGNAIGQTTLSDLARQSGMIQEDLLTHLSRALPGVVDKLTQGGRIPSQAEIARLLASDIETA